MTTRRRTSPGIKKTAPLRARVATAPAAAKRGATTPAAQERAKSGGASTETVVSAVKEPKLKIARGTSATRATPAESAKKYLRLTGFSRKGLIEQLESDAGDGFTHSQAVYGVNEAGL